MKTHVDVIEDFDASVVDRLQELSAKHDFQIFEDRKFADIGVLIYDTTCHKSSKHRYRKHCGFAVFQRRI